MGVHNKNRAWRGQPKNFDLVCLFVPDYFSVRRLDGGAVIGDVGDVFGPSSQRAVERMLSSASGMVTKRRWRSQAALLKRLVRERPDSVNAEFAAWLGPQLDSSFTEAQLTRRRNQQDVFGDWIRADGSPITKRQAPDRPPYKPLATLEERTAFWEQVLKHYGKSAQ